MPTTITGDPSAVSNSLSRTVTGATNASPIVVTTSANHEFATGDTVVISGVGGNTAANGTWPIIRVSATTFSLTGSTGSGAYTAGGTAVDVSLTPQMQAPADNDTLDAASIMPALEGLSDRTQFLALISRLRAKTWTVDTTWDAPANVQPLGILRGYGGGGEGGNGAPGSTTADEQASGGGGGGSALESWQVVSLTPGETYTIDIGAGGSGSVGLFGNDGADTTFSDSAPTVLARFKGAAGGGYGASAVPSATDYAMAFGGAAVAGAHNDALGHAQSTNNFIQAASQSAAGPGRGGVGRTKNFGVGGGPGAPSLQGYAGGTGGTDGTTSGGTREGGGGGGGGAGGPGGVGGNGGNGGNGAGVTGVAGTNGASAAANTGAGGGGGGGGGGAGTTPGAFSTGGAGGSGKLTLYYWGDPT